MRIENPPSFTELLTFDLQAPVLRNYPAKLSLTSFTCFFGLIQFLIIGAFVETNPELWKIQSGEELFTILYAVIHSKLNYLNLMMISHALYIILGIQISFSS